MQQKPSASQKLTYLTFLYNLRERRNIQYFENKEQNVIITRLGNFGVLKFYMDGVTQFISNSWYSDINTDNL